MYLYSTVQTDEHVYALPFTGLQLFYFGNKFNKLGKKCVEPVFLLIANPSFQMISMNCLAINSNPDNLPFLRGWGNDPLDIFHQLSLHAKIQPKKNLK